MTITDLPLAYHCLTMLKLADVAKSLGLSTGSVYRRLQGFNGGLDRHVRRGSNNELLFDGEALATLRRVEDIRKAQGTSIKRAIARVQQELDGNHKTTLIEGDGRLVEALEREIERLQGENVRLWRLVNDLTPRLALPRRTRWNPFKRAG